ncbi:prepilin-type cleavage/methylation-like protein [Catenovulum agarivorans DS-2]|uniref:Prepilin-type cleavage/methylation-like protein n=1 Tax=Catenovulum agarivorans DS-2 TaxID=1328313 RepID=W7QIJ7_9ALTE|nr:prepilin-type N-terminal cleavage/methylation domain-containing protein [Catenovulum agarivorans]EWH08752.1 prepilin-type cleavage/methylation-like protein [Catenovulum agarivorans DS-2]
MKRYIQQGFTLIEIVIGIVVLAITFSYFTHVLTNSNKFVADPWYQVRASELGSSLLNEILAKSFDENSDRVSGSIRCSSADAGAPACTAAANFGADNGESSRDDYDDVDDYHDLNTTGGDIIELSMPNNTALANNYANYQLSVSVIYDSDFNGTADANIGAHKLIQISITDPIGNESVFSAYRSNF